MPPTLRALLGLALLLAPASSPVHAQTTVLVPSDRDNTLYDLGLIQLSNGAGAHMFSGVTGSTFARRALVRFDVAGAVPPGSTILSAELRLVMSKTVAGPIPVALHEVEADWGEAGSIAGGEQGGGTTPEEGDATWGYRFYPDVPWSSPGGDFDATPSAVTSVGDLGAYTWTSTPELVADVQGWLDDATANFGWCLLSPEVGKSTSKRFDTREHPQPANRPRLEVTYAPPVASVATTGNACPGSAAISAGSLPTLGNATFAVDASGGAPGQLALLLLAAGTDPGLPLFSPTCLMYLDQGSALIFLQTGLSPLGTLALDGAGAGTFPFPIPADGALTGLVLGLQVVGIDTGAIGGLVSSNALELVLGA